MAKINFNRDESGKFKKKEGSFKSEGHFGTYEDMMKERAQKLPEMIKEIEKFFENWNGETVILVRTQEDENGDAIGHHEAIMGVDKAENLMGIAKHLRGTQETIIEQITANGDPKVLAAMALNMLKEMLEDGKKS